MFYLNSCVYLVVTRACVYLVVRRGLMSLGAGVGPRCLSLPHRLLVILESLAGLLIGADLLAALPLDVTLLQLLQQGVCPAQPPQHRVGCVRLQEH